MADTEEGDDPPAAAAPMAAAQVFGFGTLEQFTAGPNNSFVRYVQRMKTYFRANHITDLVPTERYFSHIYQ